MAYKRLQLVLILLLFGTFSPVTCTDDVSLQSLTTLVQQQAATIQTLQARLTGLETTVQQNKGSVTDLRTTLTGVTTRLNKRAAFTAHMLPTNTGVVNIGTNYQPITFGVVVTNIGDGYDSLTGVFRATIPGVYVFYAQIMMHGSALLHYAIEKTGTLLCVNSVDQGDDWDKSSCQATVHLQAGETVFVRRVEGAGYVEGYWSYFSGFLLSADA